MNRHSLEEMISVLNPLDSIATPQSSDPLLEAFRLVSASLKIPFTPPQELPPQKNVIEHVKAIAEASSIRYRRVRLSGTWWKNLSGPLLSFLWRGAAARRSLRNEIGALRNGGSSDTDAHTSQCTNRSRLGQSGVFFLPRFPKWTAKRKRSAALLSQTPWKGIYPSFFLQPYRCAHRPFPAFSDQNFIQQCHPECRYLFYYSPSLHLFFWQL